MWEDCPPAQKALLKGTGPSGAGGYDVPLGSPGSCWSQGWISLLTPRVQSVADHSGRQSESS